MSYKSFDDAFTATWSPFGKFAVWRFLGDVFHFRILFHHTSIIKLKTYDRKTPTTSKTYDRTIPIMLNSL